MRLIDADDFGNRMYHEAFEKDSDLQKWDSGCWIRYKLFENVLREQPTIQPEAKWTQCSERMPEEGQKCLVCDKGSIGIDTYIGHGNPYNWKWYTRDYEAWQPLSDPYKGGDSNE